jgi:hypothetical protein
MAGATGILKNQYRGISTNLTRAGLQLGWSCHRDQKVDKNNPKRRTIMLN